VRVVGWGEECVFGCEKIEKRTFLYVEKMMVFGPNGRRREIEMQSFCFRLVEQRCRGESDVLLERGEIIRKAFRTSSRSLFQQKESRMRKE
jgi:hypothetical protein